MTTSGTPSSSTGTSPRPTGKSGPRRDDRRKDRALSRTREALDVCLAASIEFLAALVVVATIFVPARFIRTTFENASLPALQAAMFLVVVCFVVVVSMPVLASSVPKRKEQIRRICKNVGLALWVISAVILLKELGSVLMRVS